MTRRKRPRHQAPHETAQPLIYGTHAVAAALTNPARTCRHLWVTANAAERLSAEIAQAGLKPELVRPDALDRKLDKGAVHQGAVLEVVPLPDHDIEDLPGSGLLVVLDQVTDPHNIGAILRSCAAFGAHGLVLTERHAPAGTGLIAKTASGGLEHVPLIRVTNLARALQSIADKGYEVLGLDGEADTDLDALEVSGAVALVLGAEGRGLRRLTAERCDRLVRLRTDGPIASLNVSNAAAVALYAISGKQPAPR